MFWKIRKCRDPRDAGVKKLMAPECKVEGEYFVGEGQRAAQVELM